MSSYYKTERHNAVTLRKLYLFLGFLRHMALPSMGTGAAGSAGPAARAFSAFTVLNQAPDNQSHNRNQNDAYDDCRHLHSSFS